MLSFVAIMAALVAQAQATVQPNVPLGKVKWEYKSMLGSSVGASFDASSMYLTSSSTFAFLAHDPYSEQQGADQYNYLYNVGGAVPGGSIKNSDCVSKDSQYAAAYRTKVSDPTSCLAMTAGYNGKGPQTNVLLAGLHDPDRPAHGWNVSYPPLGTGGLTCPPVGSLPTQMQFRIIFICEDSPTPTASQTQNGNNWTIVLNERDTTGCFTSVYVHGHVGCPTECPIVNGKLCGGNGICDFDQQMGKARCFCNSDYIESDCNTPLDPSPTGAIVGAVFGGLFMGAAVVGVYWFFRVRGAEGAAGAPADGYYEAAE